MQKGHSGQNAQQIFLVHNELVIILHIFIVVGFYIALYELHYYYYSQHYLLCLNKGCEEHKGT